MTSHPDFFTRELRFAWLLRTDVRQTLRQHGDGIAEKLFLGWWLLHGRTDYPAVAPLGAEQLAVATAPSQSFGHPDLGPLSITYLMHYVWLAREDLQQSFDLETAAGRQGLIAWYYLYGVPEHGLPVSPREAAALGAASAADAPSRFPFVLTNLALLVWIAREDLRTALNDLANPVQRLTLIAWYYQQGVHEYRLYPHLANDEIAKLLEPVRPSEQHGTPIPGWLMLTWLLDPAIRSGLNINTADGCQQLMAWGERQGRQHFRIDELVGATQEATNSKPLGSDQRRKTTPKQRTRAAIRQQDFGVNLVGYAAGELGIGEDVRMMVKSLLGTDIPFCVINRKPTASIRQSDDSILGHVSDQPSYPITIICMTGFDTVQLALERPDVFEGKYVIGYWPWELPEWPAEWHVAYDLVDEIWASSHYTKAAYERTSPKPVQYMPMTVSFDPPNGFRKSDFGLPEDRFLFLFAFDFMSYPSRKNPEACLAAFQTAFPNGDEKVGLVMKVSNVDRKDRRWTAIGKLCKKDPRIVLLGETLNRRHVLGLMSVCDAYVSLHRAEGFGRTLAEAMLLDKPVIATGYSGSADFVTDATGYVVPFRLRRVRKGEYPFAEGMKWAEPSIPDAASHFRAIFDNPESANTRRRCGRRLIEQTYGAVNTGSNYQARIAELRASLRSS